MRGDPIWPGEVDNWLVLALAHHRLRHAAEARRWLTRADQWIQAQRKELPAGDRGLFGGMHVHDWLACEILRREANVIQPE